MRTNGQLKAIQRGPRTAVSSITWEPFCGASGWQSGNGRTIDFSFDQNGRVTGSSIDSLSYDVAGQITQNATVFATVFEEKGSGKGKGVGV